MINFHPRAGQVLICDFTGYIEPEIIKHRPVVIVSPRYPVRPGLVSVVPLSTTKPFEIQNYHYKLNNKPFPCDDSVIMWAKCDLMATVSVKRLDRIKLGRGRFVVGSVTSKELNNIRYCVAKSIGIDFDNLGA